MRFKSIILLCAGTTVFLSPPLPTEEEGFVFTEEEVAAYDEEALKLQSVIGSDATYVTECFKVYSDINLIVGNCFRAIGREVDYTECADARTFASIHKEAVEKLVTKYGAEAASGQLTKGALSRAALNMARPNITPGAYNAMEKQLERTAVMLRWFMGSFARTCARYDSGFYKEVQQVARFKELTQSSEYKRMETEYPALWNYFDEGRALRRFYDSFAEFRGNISEHAYKFFERFHNELDYNEREALYNEMALGAPDTLFSKYVRMRENASIWGSTSQGAMLANFESRFDYWTSDRIKTVKELGLAVYRSAMSTHEDAAYNEYMNEALNGKQDLYINTYQAYVDRTLPSLFKMSEVLWGLEDYLKAETRYFHNLEKKEEYSICQWADTIVRSIKPRVMEMREQAARVVPQSHPSRSRN